jgi:F-type H+-transporting ATPase subunit gamma
MATVKELKDRITSVQSTQKITKAMQMVASAKSRKAQEAAQNARPYASRMEGVIAALGSSMVDGDGVPHEGSPELLVGTGKDDVHLLVVCSAEKGLCGGFNTSIAKLARAHALDLQARGKQVKILYVGKKAYGVLKYQFEDSYVDLIDLSDVKKVGFSEASEIGQRVLSLYDNGEFDVCTLFYSEFVNILTQVPTPLQLIPAKLPEVGDAAGAPDLGGAIYDFEPDEADILKDLLPRNLSVQVFRALLENSASFYGAQMTAMDNATRNAGEMIDSLSITMNRMRQANITNELIEIISGAEAL